MQLRSRKSVASCPCAFAHDAVVWVMIALPLLA